MNAPHKRREPLTGGSSAQSRDHDTAHRIDDRRELQGIASGRHADQKAPTWPAPAGKAALDALARAWNSRRRL